MVSKFLNTEKKLWIVEKKKIPVRENIPMKDLDWFRNKEKEISKLKDKPDLKESDLIGLDEEWWSHVCTIGLGLSFDQVKETGISEPNFRALMAEVYFFLRHIGTIEEALLSGMYDQKILEPESKQ